MATLLALKSMPRPAFERIAFPSIVMPVEPLYTATPEPLFHAIVFPCPAAPPARSHP